MKLYSLSLHCYHCKDGLCLRIFHISKMRYACKYRQALKPGLEDRIQIEFRNVPIFIPIKTFVLRIFTETSISKS